MPRKKHDEIETISPDAYSAAMPQNMATAFVKRLKSDAVKMQLDRTIAVNSQQLAEAVREGARRLEAAAHNNDFETAYAEAHEIRGLAGNAGLTASGRIADGLCFYLDTMARMGGAIDPGIVGLHVGSIARATNAGEEATRHGAQVDKELRALVARRLAELSPGRRNKR